MGPRGEGEPKVALEAGGRTDNHPVELRIVAHASCPSSLALGRARKDGSP